jgi:hypothetical protein
MEKEFVPYELALELKQLGFDEPCFGSYVKLTKTQNTFFMNDVVDEIDRETPLHKSLITKAPLYQQAFRWFREKYGLFHSIIYQDDNSRPGVFDYEILSKRGKSQIDECPEFDTHEEAELACLQKLIEIVKNK